MHKSIFVYAKALNCSPGHVRRLIRAEQIHSAQLVKGRTGRPHWVICDTSPAAITAVRTKLQRKGRPTFWEPIQVECFQEKGPDGRPSIHYEIRWREIFAPQPSDDIDILFDLADRAALVWHGLTRQDLFHPATYGPDRWRYVTQPASARKIKEYNRTQQRLLYALFRPPTSYTHRWVKRMLDQSFSTIDIMQAALQLALYNKVYGIEIDHRTLARVLGISKTSLYRTYGRGAVRAALTQAQSNADSTTQVDRQDEILHQHPAMESETDRPRPSLAVVLRLFFGEDSDREESFSEFRKTIDDVPFQTIYDAASALRDAGKPLNYGSIKRSLQQRGFDYYNPAEFDRAISAVQDASTVLRSQDHAADLTIEGANTNRLAIRCLCSGSR